jgi:hypothetical protein
MNDEEKREKAEREAFEGYGKPELVDLVLRLKLELRRTRAAMSFDDGVARGKQLARREIAQDLELKGFERAVAYLKTKAEGI